MVNYLKKVHINETNQYLPSEYIFISCASLETRCRTRSTVEAITHIRKTYIIRNIDSGMNLHNEDHFQSICNQLPDSIALELHFENPLGVLERLQKVIQELITSQEKSLVVDISTFTHEVLLIFLKILHINRNYFESIFLIYNGAKKYEPWLSKGCKEVRNVIGYPGSFNPAQKYHLVVLTGFEWERATRLVELLEPDVLSIGIGKDPTNSNHQETMTSFENDFKNWMENLQGVRHNQFTFSCSEITSTISSLQEILTRSPLDNFIFVPLNTKLSTISTALVALANSRVQVCYPIPEVYNISYSEPSDNVSIIDFLEIDKLS